MKINEILNEAKVDKLDPETEKRLEQTMTKLNTTKDLSGAKKLAHEFLDSMKFKEKAAKFKRGVDKANSVTKVASIVYNVKLAGEGLGVIKEATTQYHDQVSWEKAAKEKGLTIKQEDTKNQPGGVKTVKGAYDKDGKRKGHLNVVNGNYYGMFEAAGNFGNLWKYYSKEEQKAKIKKYFEDTANGHHGTVAAIDAAKHLKATLKLANDIDSLRRTIDKTLESMPELDRYRPRRH